MWRGVTTGALTLVLLAGPGAPAGAATPGDLDPGFSGDGRLVLDHGQEYDAERVRDLLITSSGKVVTVASLESATGTIWGISRLRKDGRPDPAFRKVGRRTTGFVHQDVPRRVVGLGWGRLLVGGSAGADFALAAYDRDGSPHHAFGGHGQVVTDVSPGADQVLDLRVLPDGRILAAGVAGDRFAVVRHLPDGTLDPTFGTGGVVLTTEGLHGEPTMVRLQPDGKLVAVGLSEPNANGNSGYAVARYDVDGSPDETFGGGDGRVTTHPGELRGQAEDHSRALTLLVQPDGRLVVAGSSFGDGDYRHWSMVRYLPDGTLDPGFGSGGVVWHLFGDYYAAIHAVTRQGDGRIVAAGWVRGQGDAIAVGR